MNFTFWNYELNNKFYDKKDYDFWKKILVWLSWGVDSAVSAYLLKQKWYDVIAWFMINYLAPDWEHCPTKDDLKTAKEVASYLNIPFFTFDYRDSYSEKVLDYMYEWYKKWITPNPDIMCNSEVKFNIFLKEAIDYGFYKIAMWHYAKIEIWNDWLYHLKKWEDSNKDQSYFLAWLKQNQLSKTIFPIWDINKKKVREIANDIWLPNANRKDSQWICFVWKVNMSTFLEKKIKPKPWLIKDTFWNTLWKHKWVYYYTIWQRKWLNIWWQSNPLFVVKKDIEKNELIVWGEDNLELFDDKLYMTNCNFLAKTDYKFPLKAKAKIRYRQPDQDCIIYKQKNYYKVEFENKQRAIARWQICAIYIDDELIMSWVIFW